jgi:hypothetical protein
MVGVFGFAGGPRYRTASQGEMITQALDQPMSKFGTLFDQAVGGLANAVDVGTVRRDFTIPEGTVDPRTEATRSFSLVTSPLLGAYELLRSAAQSRMDQGKPLTIQEQKDSKHFRERIPLEEGMTDTRQAALAIEDDVRSVREFYAEKRPWTALAGNFLGQMASPVNFVPFVSQAARAAQIAKFGSLGGRVLAGGLDAAANTAAFTLATAPVRARYGEDVSWQAMTSEIAMAAAIGAGFGVLGAGFSSALGTYTGRKNAQLANIRKDLLSDIDKRLATMPNVQKSTHGLNEAVVAGARGEEINLSPNAADAARIMSDRLTNDPTMMRSPMGEEMRTRFEAAGRPRDEAHALGRVYEDAYETFARRSGMTLDAFVAKVGLPEVRRGATGMSSAAAVAQAAVNDPALRAWFGDSKVVDEKGEPKVVYHGTTKDFTSFSKEASHGFGIYFTPEPDVATTYATGTMSRGITPEEAAEITGSNLEEGPRILPVFLKIRNPLEITASDYLNGVTNSGILLADRDVLVAAGYDGILVKADPDMGDDLFAHDNWIAFEPTQIKSVNNRGTFDPNDPNILNQSATIRRHEETLQKYGLQPKKKYTTRQVATALEARQREKYGVIERGDYSDKARNRIARWVVEEVMFEVDQAVKEPWRSAVGWYSTKFQKALNNMGDRFPELEGKGFFDPEQTAIWGPDPNLVGVAKLGTPKGARDFFTALMAVTSDGAKVKDNFIRAADLYEGFRTSGTLNLDFAFGNDRNASMKRNLGKIQEMLDTYGPERMHTRLLEKATVRELKALAKAEGEDFSTHYKADMELPYSAILFGPKLGAFYANLMGDTGYLTMDRWWSRTFNRYRGTLLTKPTKEGLERFKRLVTEDRRLNQPAEEMTDDEAIPLLDDYVSSYKAKNFKEGSDIEKAANTLYKAIHLNTEDQPFNASDREFMINTAVRAQGNLRRKGVDLTIADIQAVLWYYEKRLYGQLGARQTADLSYEEIARDVASRRGDDGRSTDEMAGAESEDVSLDPYANAGTERVPAESILDAEFDPGYGRTFEQSAAPGAADQAEQTDTGGRAGAQPARRADPEGLKLPAGTSRWHEGPGGHIPVNMDGMFRITHETDRVLDKIDPLKRQFTPGNREAARLGPVGTLGTAERSYYGVGDLNYRRPKGQPYKLNTDPYHGERRGHLRHVVAVDPDTIYNYKQDRLGLYGKTDAATPSERQTQYEKFIEEAGFKGTYLSETDVGQTAMMFEAREPEIVINKNTGLPVDEIAPKEVKLTAKELEPLPGLTTGRPIKRVVQAARAYALNHDIPVRRQARYVTADPDRGARIAAAYEAMQHAPNDPAVREAYAAMAEETLAQYQYVKATGLKVDAIEPGQKDPYPQGPKQVLADLEKGHLWFFPTDQGFGTLNAIDDNPLLALTDEFIGNRQLVVNDVFRIVHDFFGHGIEGSGFGARGEENAWQSHMRLYSERALPAVTSETRGQNSWVNFGPFGEQNRANQRETVFADQKTGIMPEWTWREGVEDDLGDGTTLFQDARDTPEFKRWFGKSKVVDDSGQPKVMFHGHDAGGFSAFDKARIRPDDYDAPFNGFWFSDSPDTGPAMRDAGAVMPVYLSIKNPAPADVWRSTARAVRADRRLRDGARSEGDETRARLQDAGYDGVQFAGTTITEADRAAYERDGKVTFKTVRGALYTVMDEGAEGANLYRGSGDSLDHITGYVDFADFQRTFDAENVWVAFEPNQVKSVNNRGAFDPRDPDILFQPKGPTVRGQITLSHTPVISLFETADASTALHESGHLFLEIFKGLAEGKDAPAALRADWDAVKTWWGENADAVAADSRGAPVTAADVLEVLAKGTTGNGAKDSAINVGLHEQWARGFEAYLREGDAPTPELRSVFQQFKEWLTKIYTQAKQLNVNITPEIRGVFDRLLGAEAPRQIDTAVARPDPVPAGLTEALSRIGTTEDTQALAEQFQVDPQTGAIPEDVEIAELIASGRLSEEDLELLNQATEDFEIGAAYGEAMKSLVGCMI